MRVEDIAAGVNVRTLSSLLFVFALSGCDLLHLNVKSDWLKTEDGAVNKAAFAFYKGTIHTHANASLLGELKCDEFEDPLTSESVDGVVRMLTSSTDSSFYYYKFSAATNFFGTSNYTLTHFEGEYFLRYPRVLVDKNTLNQTQESSFADPQVQEAMIQFATKLDPRGTITVEQATTMIIEVLGKQQFDVRDWVIDRLLTGDAQRFMRCSRELAKDTKEHFLTKDSIGLVEKKLKDAVDRNANL
jgi:hypothetical protein